MEITHVSGLPLRRLPLRMWDSLKPDALAKNVEDALCFWDGRTNTTMGSFNDVDTRWLRSTALGNARLGFNGTGGELYRNREHHRERRVDFDQWLAFFVIGPECTASVGSDPEAASLLSDVVRKYLTLMKLADGRGFDLHSARRWYRDVWLPFSAGPRLCAENQLAFALMPFADSIVSAESLGVTPHLGSGGSFQSAMIRTLDPEIAKVDSNYGHGLDRIPPMTRFRDSLISVFPLSIRCRYHMSRTLARARRNTIPAAPQLRSVTEGLELLRQLKLPIRWDVLMSRSFDRDRCYYIAHFLHSFREHFDIGLSATGRR
jgi:hypothetical protein